jgi:hypothetical protein
MTDSLNSPYINKREGLIVRVVDGAYIRGHIDEEFTNFGQHYRYKYIPEADKQRRACLFTLEQTRLSCIQRD